MRQIRKWPARFEPISCSKVSRDVLNNIIPLSIVSFRSPKDHWELRHQGNLLSWMNERNLLQEVCQRLNEWETISGYKIRKNSVLRYAEIPDENGVHIHILVFRTVDHFHESVELAQVSTVMER